MRKGRGDQKTYIKTHTLNTTHQVMRFRKQSNGCPIRPTRALSHFIRGVNLPRQCEEGKLPPCVLPSSLSFHLPFPSVFLSPSLFLLPLFLNGSSHETISVLERKFAAKKKVKKFMNFISLKSLQENRFHLGAEAQSVRIKFRPLSHKIFNLILYKYMRVWLNKISIKAKIIEECQTIMCNFFFSRLEFKICVTKRDQTYNCTNVK